MDINKMWHDNQYDLLQRKSTSVSFWIILTYTFSFFQNKQGWKVSGHALPFALIGIHMHAQMFLTFMFLYSSQEKKAIELCLHNWLPTNACGQF